MERYESLGLVGEGSYGSVLKCRHRDSGRLVAIKKFVDSDDDKTVKKIALREIKLLKQLRHDNLVNLLDVWKRRRRWYLVFEFVERTLLDDLEQNPGGLDPDTSRRYLFQILRAAAFCHQQNIIHRDIKPENILISQGGVVKLCDFGFARTAEGGVYTDYVATRWYRAPELLVGDTKYSKPVDVWAVGCLLIEMLTGQPLFPGDSDLDQIHHIVRCFGNPTARHQELFYRNPVFSGVRLPEYSARVRLEQRFPTVTPAALHLAQSCLQMDPEQRAQCSELLEHPLFTRDAFHIRVLHELNAKIQKDHRENSILPKIAKTPRREKDDVDEKNRRSKDKKRPDVDEKVKRGEEKMEKTKAKQPSKLSRTIRNTSEPLMTKQFKTTGAKILDNAAKTTMKRRAGKTFGAELRQDPDVSKPTTTCDSLEASETRTGLKERTAVKPKHATVSSPEPQDDRWTNTETRDGDSGVVHFSRPDNIVSRVTEIWTSSHLESRDSAKSSNAKVPKVSKSSTSDLPVGGSSPKASLKSTADRKDAHFTQKMGKISSKDSATITASHISNGGQLEESLTPKAPQSLSNEHIEATTVPYVTKSCKKTTTTEPRTECSNTDWEQRKTSEGPKVLTSNPKMTQNNTTSKTFISNLSSAGVIEASPAHSTTPPPKGTSSSKLSKTSSFIDTKPTSHPTCVPNEPPRGLTADEELTEEPTATMNLQDGPATKDGSEDHESLKTIKTDANHREISSGDDKENPESSEPLRVHQLRSKISTESRTSTSTLNFTSAGTIVPKRLNVSDEENREGLVVSVGATSLLVDRTSKVSISEASLRSKPLIGEALTKMASFGSYTKSTAAVAPETQDTTFSTEARRKREGNDPTTFTSAATPDQRASSRSNTDTEDVNQFDVSGRCSSPPPPPSSTLLPSFSVGRLTLGIGIQPETHRRRCVDKPKHHGGVSSRPTQQSSHVTGPLAAQVSEKRRERSFLSDHCNHGNSGDLGNVTVTKRKSDVHFPDVRSSLLPELRGRGGKHSKATWKDPRKELQQQDGSDAPTP